MIARPQAWRGLPPRLIWSAPLAGATFTYYQVLKRETTDTNRGQQGGRGLGAREASATASSSEDDRGDSTRMNLSLKTIVGGPAVLALSVALRTPFDIIEQQLQLSAAARQHQHHGASPSKASTPFAPTPAAIRARLAATWREEGARGVWRGYPAAFFGIFSYVAGYFVIYEGARRAIESRSLFDRHPTVTHLVAGGLGGGLTAMLATPFDTVKVRMQTRVYETAAMPFPTMAHVCRATIKDAGWRGLWRGALARGVSNAPSGAIMFAVYEAGHRFLDARLGAFRARAGPHA